MSWEPLPSEFDHTRDLGSVLGRLQRTMGLARPDSVRLIEANWTALVGPELCTLASLDSLQGDEMVVVVTDPAVAAHLRWQANDLARAVNSVCGAEVVATVRFRVAVS